MKKYADYDFYVSEFNGRMTVENFEAAIVPASAYIKYATLGRSEKSEDEALKYAACAACDAYRDVFLVSDEESGRIIKSENTDGYSVTYAVESDGSSKEYAFKKKAAQAVKMYLSGTGLIKASVGVIK